MKKIIIPGVIIMALAIAYYFVSFLLSQKIAQAKQEKQAFLFSKQTECKTICESVYRDLTNSLSNVLIPQYVYNEDKNTCFYSGGWWLNNGSTNSLTQRIVNCQTNEEVLSFTTVDNKEFCLGQNCVSSIDEYETKKKEFMGN